MSTISSSTLFHFTSSADILIKVIKSGFAPRFCLEEFGPELFIVVDKKYEQAVPMTCFCDLPLSKIHSHLEFYGSYGIGLSKKWGRENGLTPITYIHENSTQIKYLRQLGELIFSAFKGNKIFDSLQMDKNPIIALFELAGFFKPYEGEMWRLNKYISKRFYDEREWRYVPFLGDKDIQYRLSKEEFLNEIKRANANELIAQKYSLKFKCDDVKYLIVSKEVEMVALSDTLETMNTIFNSDEIKILKTKIISCEQIRQDF